MNLDQTYEKNREKISKLLPNCRDRFFKFLDLCWSKKLYFVIPQEGGLRTEDDQLLLLTKGRTFDIVKAKQKSLGLTDAQLMKMKKLYDTKKNVEGSSMVTWTVFSNHLDGKAIDCLPISFSQKEQKTILIDSSKTRKILQTMELLAKDQNIGVFRPSGTMLAGDYAHFEAFDLPIKKSEQAQKLINKRNERIKNRLSLTL